MVKTEYICDKCKTVVERKELITIGIVVNYTPMQYHNIQNAEAAVQWCTKCAIKGGIVKWQKKGIEAPAEAPSIETKLRELLLTVLPEVMEIKKPEVK